MFSFAGNNQDCSHTPHTPHTPRTPRTPHIHIKEVAGVAAAVVGVVVATGVQAVQVKEGTTMIVAKGADTAHIRWSLMYWEISILLMPLRARLFYRNVILYCFSLNIY